MDDPRAPPSPSLPLFQNTQVAIAPVQTEIVIARLTMEGKALVGIQVTTPLGVAFYFLDPEQAKTVGETLQRVASGVLHSASSLASALARVDFKKPGG